MSKQNTLNILSQVEDMVGNVMESEDFTDSDIQLQKEVKAAIKWTKKASVKNTRDKSEKRCDCVFPKPYASDNSICKKCKLKI